MSDTTISLEELEKLRAGWPASIDPVLSNSGNWYGEFDHSDNEHGNEGYIECSSSDMDEAPRFAALIAAEHNASPTLIAVAKAALRWRRTLGAPRGDNAADAAERALIAAIAGVSP